MRMPNDSLISQARYTPDWRAGPDPYALSWGSPSVYVGILVVCGMFYGLHRWQKWANANHERRRQERVKKYGR